MNGVFNFGFCPPCRRTRYTGKVTQSGDQTAVLLNVASGPVGVRPSVLWTGADVPNLNTNWSDRLNWQLPGVPGLADNVVFSPTAAQTASALSTPGGGASSLVPDYMNNIVDTNVTVSSLTFTNVDGSYHNTLIKDGLTLTHDQHVDSGQQLADSGRGARSLSLSSGPTARCRSTIPTARYTVGLGSGSAGAPQGHFGHVCARHLQRHRQPDAGGVGSGMRHPPARPNGTVYLAQTNTIIASLAVRGPKPANQRLRDSLRRWRANGNAAEPASYT